jgi:acetylornithine/N-succinyldiaminopimelate aminotransferase
VNPPSNNLLQSPVLPVYARQDVTFTDGDGAWLVADTGERFLDLVAGIAVVGLGHCHPAPLAAAHEQLDQLWHVSNLYWTEPMAALAGRLSDRFGGGQAFFCNSGTEAVEAALKLARKATGRPGLLTLEGSFHGRTMGALSVTGQPAKRAAFEPLVPGASFATPNDVESLVAAARPDTGAILLEPIQGEGGVRPLTQEFLAAARTLADELGALLLLDEVQTGTGRTGTFFCFEQSGVRPDAVTLAKGLANGLPIGVLLVADEHAGALVPGDHASTFGGNPVACAAACAVVDELTDELLAAVRAKEELVRGRFPDVRGRGLLLGLDVGRPAAEVVEAAFERGVLVCTAGPGTVRLTPPLTITTGELEHGLAVLGEVLWR